MLLISFFVLLLVMFDQLIYNDLIRGSDGRTAKQLIWHLVHVGLKVDTSFLPFEAAVDKTISN